MIHRLSIRSVLAEHENARLNEALINGRQRRKRSKTLLEAAAVYHGRAVFFSPRKVDETRDRQQQEGLEKGQPQHQKAEAPLVREEQRQGKLRAVNARYAARTAAQLIRQEEKARKASDRASRQAARRTQQRLQ